MVRKSPGQLALFDYRPEKSIVAVKEYKPLNTEISVLVCYKENIDKTHVVCPLDDSQNSKQYYEKVGYVVTVFTNEDYWYRFHAGQFELGKP